MKLRPLLIVALFAHLTLIGCAAGPAPAPPSEAVTLRGTVRDHRGFAVSELALIATSREGGGAHSGYTDRSGAYSVAGLSPGTYQILLLKDGAVAGQTEIAFRGGRILDLHFELEAARPRDPLGPLTGVELGPRARPISSGSRGQSRGRERSGRSRPPG